MSAAGEEMRALAGSELDRRFAGAKSVADTVCYEGYVLYPYRASSRKNQVRWQFGVLAPPSVAAGGSEQSAAQAQIVVETRPGARLQVRLRALQVQQRVVQALDGEDFVPVASLEDGEQVWISFDEAVEHQADLVGVDLEAAAQRGCSLAVNLAEDRREEPIVAADGFPKGRVVRQRWPVSAALDVRADPIEGPYSLTRVTLALHNDTDWADPTASRDEAMRRSLVAAHLLVAVDGGRIISSLEPPRFAAGAVAECTNTGLFPVLVGQGDDDDVVLASPIILYDYPVVAPESEGDMFDATEIDEILALRVQTLTEEEKRQARSTDPRSAAIIDRCDAMDADALDALHGTFRSVRSLRPQAPAAMGDEAPWWEPQVDDQPGAGPDGLPGSLEGQGASEPEGEGVTSPAEQTGAGAAPPRVLVAGVGNIFFGDDAFGVEVARRLDPAGAPPGVKVVDFGIRGVHLAYELLEGYDTLVLIDAVSRGDPPGTVSVIEHAPESDSEGLGTLAAMDAHGMNPGAVLAMAGDLGAHLERVLVVACEAADVEEGIGLSEPVAEAVPHAVAAVQELLGSITGAKTPIQEPIPKEAP